MTTNKTLDSYDQRIKSGLVTKDDLHAEREVILDLYKHHLKLLLEANTFVYAVTGAITSFVATHLAVPHIKWVLVFPCIFTTAFAIFFALAGKGIDWNEKELDQVSAALKVNVIPNITPLKLGLVVSSCALGVLTLLGIIALSRL